MRGPLEELFKSTLEIFIVTLSDDPQIRKKKLTTCYLKH